jgi:hypothetical protein
MYLEGMMNKDAIVDKNNKSYLHCLHTDSDTMQQT